MTSLVSFSIENPSRQEISRLHSSLLTLRINWRIQDLMNSFECALLRFCRDGKSYVLISEVIHMYKARKESNSLTDINYEEIPYVRSPSPLDLSGKILISILQISWQNWTFPTHFQDGDRRKCRMFSLRVIGRYFGLNRLSRL